MFFKVTQTAQIEFFIEAQDADEAYDIIEDMWNHDVIQNRLDVRNGLESTDVVEYEGEPNEYSYWIVFIDEDDQTKIR